MNDRVPLQRGSRRRALGAAALLLLALGAGSVLVYFSQPQRATRLILDRTGDALGLEITASGGDYRLRGVPALVVRDVVAREPGANTPLLRAARIELSLPWSTIRGLASGSGATSLTIDRIELDRPVVDLAAFQRWLERRAPAQARVPTLTRGVHVRDGRLVAGGWSVDSATLDLPRLAPGEPVSIRTSGRYLAGGTALPFGFTAALSKPALPTALGLAGDVEIRAGSWRLPAHVVLSGMLRMEAGVLLDRAKLAAAARYVSGDTKLPFAFGAAGTLRYSDAAFALAPAGVAVRGTGAIPDLTAGGMLAIADALEMQLAGRLHAWPPAWPALPAPIGRSDSPLPFRLHYRGRSDLSGIAQLRLVRDATRLDVRLRPSTVGSWLDLEHPSPLPPLEAKLTTPELEIAGAQLRGVEITLDDPALQGASP